MSNRLIKAPLIIRVVFLYLVLACLGGLVWWSWTVVEFYTRPVPPLVLHVHPAVGRTPIEKQIVDGEPTWFNLDRLGISLPIKNGYYSAANNNWTLSSGTVYYAVVSTPPNNQSGSTFLYGHNQDNALAKLSGLVIGDELRVTTANGYIFYYRYRGDEFVAPSNTTALRANPAKPQLVVMTCEGILSLTRRLMYFDFTEVQK